MTPQSEDVTGRMVTVGPDGQTRIFDPYRGIGMVYQESPGRSFWLLASMFLLTDFSGVGKANFVVCGKN